MVSTEQDLLIFQVLLIQHHDSFFQASPHRRGCQDQSPPLVPSMSLDPSQSRAVAPCIRVWVCLTENARSCRNCRHSLFTAAGPTFSLADPADTALCAQDFSGGVCVGRVPLSRATNDLSKVTIYRIWEESERTWGERLTTSILADCYCPPGSKRSSGFSRLLPFPL